MTQIPERSSALIQFDLEDENGVGPTIDNLTLTLYDLETKTIINGRNKQNVFNANGVTIATAGSPAVTTVSYVMEGLDNQIIGTPATERHVALFEGTYSGGKPWKHELIIPVVNLHLVP